MPRWRTAVALATVTDSELLNDGYAATSAGWVAELAVHPEMTGPKVWEETIDRVANDIGSRMEHLLSNVPDHVARSVGADATYSKGTHPTAVAEYSRYMNGLRVERQIDLDLLEAQSDYKWDMVVGARQAAKEFLEDRREKLLAI